MSKFKILLVFGTRPEAIKMAPLVKVLQTSKNIEVRVCVTGQHKEMLEQVLKIYNIYPDYNLEIMSKNQTLSNITVKIINGLEDVFKTFFPNLVLVHGDTTTALATALVSFYNKIEIGHVEAGLRTYNISSPFPEEANRQLISKISKWHFAPTQTTYDNLIKESIDARSILVSGNTVIDSLRLCLTYINGDNIKAYFKEEFKEILQKKYILITGHRRENIGSGFENICNAILHLSEKYHDVNFVYPVHLNPAVCDVVREKLGSRNNVFLLNPLEYKSFCFLMENCYLIMTDSGGIQEEAPYLGKPVILMRDNTERPEAIDAGTVKMVGSNTKYIINEVSELIDNSYSYEKMSKAHNPYGDGNAAQYIYEFIKEKYNLG